MVFVASWSTRDRYASGGAGHDQQPRGALVQPVHDPGSVRRTHARRDQLCQLREPGQQTPDEGPLDVARARVDDQPGRLVHHGQVVVGVHHREADVGFGRVQPSPTSGSTTVSWPLRRSSVRPDATGTPSTRTRPVATSSDATARETSAIIATPRSTRTPANSAGTSVVTTSSPSPGVPTPPPLPGHRGTRATMTIMTPTVTHASARLNVGQ